MTYGGRLYLSKDARMSEEMFKCTYEKWLEFAGIRKKYGADKLVHSLQSKRLGL
jgi:decaprenylphospho-beta-D-ribofuranose 2-oxidase